MPGKIRGTLIHLRTAPDQAFLSDTLSRLRAFLPGLPVYCNLEIPGLERAQGNSLFECAKHAYALSAQSSPAGADDGLAVFSGLAPYLDVSLSAELMEVHLKYYAHYSYVENAPAGFLPDFVSADFLADAEPGPQDLREFVFKNIEKYDVEVLYREPDLRQFRLDFSCQTDRSCRITSELKKIQAEIPYASLGAVIRANPAVLRPYPSYFEVELTGRSVLSPRIVPLPADQTDLDSALFEKLCADIAAGGLSGDVSICLGGWGEPVLHPQFTALVGRALAIPQLQTLYVETYGAGYPPELLDHLGRIPHAEKLCVIVRLATLKRDRYRFLYGEDRFAEVMALVEKFEAGKRPYQVFMEMPRIKDVEDEVTPYYDRFEKSNLPVILNKFNRYIDLLEERRVSDLVPLEREFCWHLARDFYLRRDGFVPLCKQDTTGKRGPSLDFRSHSVASILEKTMPYHSFSVQGQHERIPMPCLSCDEWYTFNG
jgi:spiro-SPASM protein